MNPPMMMMHQSRNAQASAQKTTIASRTNAATVNAFADSAMQQEEQTSPISLKTRFIDATDVHEALESVLSDDMKLRDEQSLNMTQVSLSEDIRSRVSAKLGRQVSHEDLERDRVRMYEALLHAKKLEEERLAQLEEVRRLEEEKERLEEEARKRKEAEEVASRRIEELKREAERQAAEEERQRFYAEEEARLQREAEDRTKKRLEALKILADQKAAEAEKERLRAADKARILEQQKELERQRAIANRQEAIRQENKVQVALKRIGGCMYGFPWRKVQGGYLCSSGVCFVSDKDIEKNLF